MTSTQLVIKGLEEINTSLKCLAQTITLYGQDITALKLAQARMQGQIDMLWKVAALALMAAIAALVMSTR